MAPRKIKKMEEKREVKKRDLKAPQDCKMPWMTMKEQRERAKKREQDRARQAACRERKKEKAGPSKKS